MSIYFTEPYKTYFEVLDNASNNFSKQALSNGENVQSSINDLGTSVDTSTWQEKGLSEIQTNLVPSMKSDISSLNDNLETLELAANATYGELYTLSKKFNDLDQEYDMLGEKIRSTSSEEQKNEYLSRQESIVKEIEYVKGEIDKTTNYIKGLNGNVKDTSIPIANALTIKTKDKKGISVLQSYKDKSTGTTITTIPQVSVLRSYEQKTGKKITIKETETKTKTITVKEAKTTPQATTMKRQVKKLDLSITRKKETEKKKTSSSQDSKTPVTTVTGNTTTWNTLGETFVVANTKVSAQDYAKVVASKRICQTNDTSRYGDMCLAFSYVHASNMFKGCTSDGAPDAGNYKHASEFYDYLNDDKQTTLNVIYDQIQAGRPVVLQVNGNKQGTSRHFVTVVGYKSSVTSGATIKESDLLIIDSWDGKVERMDQSTSRFMTTGKACHKSYSGYYLRLLK